MNYEKLYNNYLPLLDNNYSEAIIKPSYAKKKQTLFKLVKMKRFILQITLLFFVVSLNAQEFDGLWKSQGYGLFVEIQDGILDLYNYTNVGMFPEISVPIIGNTIPTAGTLKLVDGFLIFEDCCDEIITFETTTEKPAIIEESADPQLNFDFFWHNLEDWCALFPILNLDWQAEYESASAQITTSTSQEELFAIMSIALGKFNDGHSILLNPETEELYRGDPEITGLWGENAMELRSIIEQKYIVEDEFKVFLDKQFSYGTLANNIGYIMINAFAFDEDSEQDNELYVNALDESINYLQNTDGLIIDIRGNNGGYDGYGRLLANRLTKEKLHVYSKQVRLQESYDAFSEPRKFFIEPEGLQYIDRPVVVLTSQASVSAADVFSMTVKEIDCVTSMGTNSYGVFSNVWTKELPNGWILGFSPERYVDKDGIDYEQKGIEPDIVVEESVALFNEGVDNVLEYAIENISASCDVMINVVENKLPEFTLFPNPTSDYVVINLADLKESVRNVSLMNIAGLQVANITNALENGNRYFLDVSDLSSGIYTIMVQTDFEIYGKKLVVQ